MSDTSMLLPCPFCGSTEMDFGITRLADFFPNCIWVQCLSCDARGPAYEHKNNGKEKAIEKWNSIPRRVEYEKLKEDFETAARGSAEESVKAARLEREAAWLARWLAKCEDIPCPEHPCSRSGKDGCLHCWRDAARKAVEDAENEH